MVYSRLQDDQNQKEEVAPAASLLDMVIPYVHSGDGGQELRVALSTLKNVGDWSGKVWIVGSYESWFEDLVGLTHLQAPRADIKWIGIQTALLIACEHPEVSERFYYSNDDIYCRPRIQLYDYNNDVGYDIIDLYGMYSRWLYETGVSEEDVPDALRTVYEDRLGWFWSTAESKKQRIELFGKWLSENPKYARLLPNALPEVDSLWGHWRERGASSKEWDEVDKDLQHLAGDEAEVLQSELSFIQVLWWSGDNSIEEMVDLFRVLRRYGRSSRRQKPRQNRRKWGLYQRELSLGDTQGAGPEHQEKRILDYRRAEQMYSGVVGIDWDTLLDIAVQGSYVFREVPQVTIPPLYKNTWAEDDYYGNTVQETRKYLMSHNIADPLNYEPHAPLPVVKADFKVALEICLEHAKTRIPLQVRTIYGNMFAVGGELFDDKKSMDGEKVAGDIISTGEYQDWLEDI